MGWLITLGIIALLAVLPLGVSIRYDENGVLVRLLAGPVKITLFPRPRKDRKQKKEKANKMEEQKSARTKPPKDIASEPVAKPAAGEEKPKKQSGGPITDFWPLLKVVLDMLGAFRRKLRLNKLELKVVMAADDPCDLAVNYGRAWAAVGNLMPRLERVFTIKKRNVEIECDFEAAKTLITARLDLTITLGRIIGTAVFYGVKVLIEFFKIKNKRKGGASK